MVYFCTDCWLAFKSVAKILREVETLKSEVELLKAEIQKEDGSTFSAPDEIKNAK